MWFCLKSKCLTHVIELVEEIASIFEEFNSRSPISNGSIYIALSRTRRSEVGGWSNWVGELELRRDHLPTGHYPPGLSAALNWYKGGTDTSPICSKLALAECRMTITRWSKRAVGFGWVVVRHPEKHLLYIYCSTGYGTLYWVVPAWFDVCIVGWLLVAWLFVGWLLAVQCNSIGWLLVGGWPPGPIRCSFTNRLLDIITCCLVFTILYPHPDCICPISFSLIELL